MTSRAQVRVAVGAGIDIEHARTDRIEVVDGALRVTRVGAPPIVVASAADVTEVLWLDGRQTTAIFGSPWSSALTRLDRRAASVRRSDGVPVWFAGGCCVVLTADGPVAAWFIDQTTPGGGDVSVRRAASGSVALARSLGVTLEALPPDRAVERRAVRRVAVNGTGETAGLTRVSLWGSMLAVVLAALSFAGFDGAAITPAATFAWGLTVVLTVLSVHARRRALALMDRPPPPAGRVVHPAITARSHIQVGADDIVLVTGDGTEHWLAGPNVVSGVHHIQLVDDHFHFLNSRRETITMEPADRIVSDPAAAETLRADAAAVGVDLEILIPPQGRSRPVTVTDLLRHGWHSGDVTVVQSWLLWPLAPMLFVAGAATANEVEWWGRIIQATAVIVLACRVWCTWALRRWIARAERGDPW